MNTTAAVKTHLPKASRPRLIRHLRPDPRLETVPLYELDIDGVGWQLAVISAHAGEEFGCVLAREHLAMTSWQKGRRANTFAFARRMIRELALQRGRP